MCSEKIQKIPAPKRVPENPPGPAGGGFVKLYRDVAGSLLLHDGELLRLYIWCLVRASFQPETVSIRTGRGFTNIQLQPGQLAFQKTKVARELGWKPLTALRRLRHLESMGFIEVEVIRQTSIVSIVNSSTCKANGPEDDTLMIRQLIPQTPENGYAKLSEKSNDSNNFPECSENCDTPKSGKVIRQQIPKKLNKEIKKNPPISPQGDDGGFGRFWQEYPRKVAKQAALKAWKKTAAIRPPLAEILSALEVQKSSAQWTREGGRFIPHPATWLNQGRWDDEIQDEPEDDCTFFRPYLRGEMQ